MRNRILPSALIVLAALAALVLAACGDDDSSDVDVGDLGPDPATVVPSDAPLYFEATVRPEGEMLDDFNETIGKFTGGEDPGALIQQGLDSELAEDDLTYAEDIEPWLGQRIGGFITEFDPKSEDGEGAAVISVTDADAAQAFLDKARESSDEEATEETYNGVDYLQVEDGALGIDGDFMILGTQQGFEDAVDAAAGDSLADNGEASEGRDEVPENSIFSAYADTQAIIDLVESSGSLTGEQLRQFEEQVAQYSEGSVNFWGVAGDDTITFAGSGPAPTDAGEPSDLVGTFPSEAWLAFAAGDVGAQLESSLASFQQGFEAGFESTAPPGFKAPNIDPIEIVEEETGINLEEDLAWIGDVGGFVQGTSLFGLGGAVVIEATDEDQAADVLDSLQTTLGKERSLQISPTDGGFDITPSGSPVGAQVALQDGKVVGAAGGITVEEALSPDETLGDSDRFEDATEALGDDMTTSFYLDFLPILQLVESSGQAANDPDYQSAKPYLDALDYLVAGSSIDDDRSTVSVALGLREPEGDDSETSAAVLTP